MDTTVQEKAITYPTDAKLCHRMREKLVRLAKKHGIELRQSYKFLSKKALFMQGLHSRSRKPGKSTAQARKIKVYLGRVVRDIGRNVTGKPGLAETFSASLALARRILAQKRGDKGKAYSVHEPEVQRIAKGVDGDVMNALLAGAGQNIRRLLAALLLFIFGWRQKSEFCPAI